MRPDVSGDTVNRACTPPSADLSGLRPNRTSRTGPFNLRKAGAVFPGAMLAVLATWRFNAGLDPPSAGCA